MYTTLLILIVTAVLLACKVNDELCRLTGVECRLTTAYHPQTNGLDERFNQTLQQQLLKFIDTDQTNWDLYIDSILFSYRVSRQDSTKESPFTLMYGRKATLPVDFNSKPGDTEENSRPEDEELDVDAHVTKMLEVRKKALHNIKIAQKRQKRYYDAKHGQAKANFAKGSQVLLFNSRKHSKKGMKLAPDWTGPYIIHEILSKGTCRLQDPKNNRVLAQKYNVTRLKLYFPRSGPNMNPSSVLPTSPIPSKSPTSLQESMQPHSEASFCSEPLTGKASSIQCTQSTLLLSVDQEMTPSPPQDHSSTHRDYSLTPRHHSSTPPHDYSLIPHCSHSSTPSHYSSLTPEHRQSSTPDRGRSLIPDRGHSLTPDSGRSLTPDRGHSLSPDRGRSLTPDSGRSLTPDRGHSLTPDHDHSLTPDRGHSLTLPSNQSMTPPHQASTPCAQHFSVEYSLETSVNVEEETFSSGVVLSVECPPNLPHHSTSIQPDIITVEDDEFQIGKPVACFTPHH